MLLDGFCGTKVKFPYDNVNVIALCDKPFILPFNLNLSHLA